MHTAGSDVGGAGAVVDGQQQQQQQHYWQRLNAAATVDGGVCATRREQVEMCGLAVRRATRSEGGRGSTGRGGSWHRGRAQGLSRATDVRWESGCAVSAVGAARVASVSQAAARSWMASEQHWAHYRGMQSRGAAQRAAGSRRAVLRCGGRRRERCELWVRGTTHERKQFGPLLLPTHSAACIPHGTFEGAQKPPVVLEAIAVR